MTDPRIEALERIKAAFVARDFSSLSQVMSEDFVADWSESRGPAAGIYRGREAAIQFISDFTDVFDSLSWDFEEVQFRGPAQAIIKTRFTASGSASGVEIVGRGALLGGFDGERITGLKLFQSLSEAQRHQRVERLAAARLYFVCEGRPGNGDPESLLAAALRGGVDVIQLREKAPRCAEEMVALAEPFRRAAAERGALFFVNDDPQLVEPCGADGVHLGQDDLPVAEARSVCGPTALIGLSTHSPEQFDAAISAEGDDRPDQISAGPVWETPTKPGRPAAGLGLIEHAAASGTDAAWFAIGGIDADNIGEVVAAGARRAVVVRAIRDAADPEAAARALREALDG